MLNPVKPYSLSFTSDGIATALTFDASLSPINEDFAGNLPSGMFLPLITASGTGVVIPTYEAVLTGTSITVTFSTAPPQLDINSVPVVYTFTFYLQFPN